MYIPHTEKEKQEMLKTLGFSSIDELFSPIPEEVRLKKELDLPPAMTEIELMDYFHKLSEKNSNLLQSSSFLGAGAYNHFIPSAVSHLASRAEFYTAYTPYQPEISQGMLQAIFEYQTLICQLTGLDISNASHYNGATAMCEAALMALSQTRRKKVMISSAVHPDYRQILKTYFLGQEENIVEIPYENGITDFTERDISSNTGAVIIQNPNFFGSLEDVSSFAEKVHKAGAILVVTVLEPFSLGVLKSPGTCGADIVAGEGYSFGNPISFGGPHLGFLACTKKLMRKMAGRLVGITEDHDGKRGFVLTLQTREQHIRRERATSNICSNQALCALAATIYLSFAGKKGFKEVSLQSFNKAHYAKKKISQLKGYEIVFSAPFFNEFLVRCPKDVYKINDYLKENKVIGGYSVEKHYPELKNTMLFAFTERNSREDIDYLVRLLGEVG